LKKDVNTFFSSTIPQWIKSFAGMQMAASSLTLALGVLAANITNDTKTDCGLKITIMKVFSYKNFGHVLGAYCHDK
jgi:hypothetical protein